DVRAIPLALQKAAHTCQEQRLPGSQRTNPMKDNHESAKTTLSGKSSRPILQSDCERVQESKRSPHQSERDAMFACLEAIVLDGLRHGFFDCFITCELVNERKRRVVIKAGKSHQFLVREEDLRG